MKIRPTQTILAVVVTILPAFASNRTEKQKQLLPAITLRVLNQAQVDKETLRKAREEATEILARAGVGLVWVDCGSSVADSKDREPCQRVRGRAEFWFRLTADRPAWTSENNMGFTVRTGEDGSAGVYYPAVIRLATAAQKSNLYALARGFPCIAMFTPGFLGAAIVHEVGHLILGVRAHTPDGVMSAQWGPEQFELIWGGKLNFARDQARLLQIEVSRRVTEVDPSQRP